MEKFLVSFKGYKKYQIESQDMATAKMWAEKQLKLLKREFAVTVTPMNDVPAPVDVPIENDKKPKPKKKAATFRRRSA